MRRVSPATCCGLAAASLASVAIPASAQDLEPRAYVNTPIGLNFLVAGYTRSAGDVAVDSAGPLTNAKLRLDTGTVAYSRSLAILGQSAKFDVVLPYASLSGDAQLAGRRVQRDAAGLADPRFRLSVNFFGAPALTIDEYPSFRQDLIVGASAYLWVPWGRYDAGKLVNLGSNRWAWKAELGVSKAIGPWTLEAVPAATFFADNADFAGGRTRGQDPIYSLQLHAIYAFPTGVWLAVDGTYFAGGQTSIDGEPGRDRQSNARAGLTVALPLDRSNSVKLYASTGVSTRSGGDFDTFGIAWQHRWGGGFERLVEWRRRAGSEP
jgi:hypothetical protein